MTARKNAHPPASTAAVDPARTQLLLRKMAEMMNLLADGTAPTSIPTQETVAPFAPQTPAVPRESRPARSSLHHDGDSLQDEPMISAHSPRRVLRQRVLAPRVAYTARRGTTADLKGLTAAQATILNAIAMSKRPLTVTAIAERTDVAAKTVKNAVSLLDQKGLIEKHAL